MSAYGSYNQQQRPQNRGYYQQQPSQNGGYNQQQPPQNRGYYQQQPSQNRDYYQQQPSQNGGYYQQQPPQNRGYYQQQPSQNRDYYQQKPAASDSYQLQATKPQQYEKSNIIHEKSDIIIDENKINQNPKYNDLWAALLFLVCLISYVIVGGMGVKALITNMDGAAKSGPLVKLLGISFAVAIVSGFLFTVVYFFLMQRFAGKMIWATGVLTIVINIALALLAFVFKVIPAAVVMLLFAGGLAVFFYVCRHRIPFAKVMLKTVTRVTGQFPATMFSGFIGLCVELGISIIFALSVAGWMSQKDQPGASTAGMSVTLYMLFCFFWCSQVVQNTVHVTVSGLFATVYFMGTADQTRQFKVTVPVQNPTAKSAKRALTTSFGSICYGSLIVALIQIVKWMIDNAKNQAKSEGSLFAFFCLYCLSCIMRIIESIVEYFNKYAFTQVAIYGKDYCTAGKDTWRLVKSRGVDAIINDCFVGTVLGFGSFFTGLLAGGLALFVALKCMQDPAYLPKSENKDSYKLWVMILAPALGFFAGMAEFNIMGEVITSGVTTIFVCLAEDPYALQRTQPELFQKVVDVYPEVMNPT